MLRMQGQIRGKPNRWQANASELDVTTRKERIFLLRKMRRGQIMPADRREGFPAICEDHNGAFLANLPRRDASGWPGVTPMAAPDRRLDV